MQGWKGEMGDHRRRNREIKGNMFHYRKQVFNLVIKCGVNS